MISVKHAPRKAHVSGPQFQFIHSQSLSAEFNGKVVDCVEVCEVASPDFSPVPLRMRIYFTDGTFLDVDRKSTALPRTKRKIMHLNLAWQSRH
ncbi:MAG: hypothetical protein KGZ92_01160 [Firmicutes bacterium]|nr:hypothetical protein [Dethiobacter sp.]MBS3887894.1 hypothetical protein [Bacillota bacterium]